MSWIATKLSIQGLRGIMDRGGDFELAQERSPRSIAIYAPNACGKSSYADAIEYLFSEDGSVGHLGKGEADSERGGKYALPLQALWDALTRLKELCREQEEYPRVKRSFDAITEVIQERAAALVNDVVAALRDEVQFGVGFWARAQARKKGVASPPSDEPLRCQTSPRPRARRPPHRPGQRKRGRGLCSFA